MAANFFLKDY